jgi:hypothetical protein
VCDRRGDRCSGKIPRMNQRFIRHLYLAVLAAVRQVEVVKKAAD